MRYHKPHSKKLPSEPHPTVWEVQDTAVRTAFCSSRQIAISSEGMGATYSQLLNPNGLRGWSVSLSFTKLVTQSFAAPTSVNTPSPTA